MNKNAIWLPPKQGFITTVQTRENWQLGPHACVSVEAVQRVNTHTAAPRDTTEPELRKDHSKQEPKLLGFDL